MSTPFAKTHAHTDSQLFRLVSQLCKLRTIGVYAGIAVGGEKVAVVYRGVCCCPKRETGDEDFGEDDEIGAVACGLSEITESFSNGSCGIEVDRSYVAGCYFGRARGRCHSGTRWGGVLGRTEVDERINGVASAKGSRFEAK